MTTIAVSNIASARYQQTVFIWKKKEVATLEDRPRHFSPDQWVQ
jgi:hypothetical protein